MSENIYNRAIELLTEWRLKPLNYATTYEAWIAMVFAIIEFIDLRVDEFDFYEKHLGYNGNTYTNLLTPLNKEWAQSVIDDAIFLIKAEKLKAFI